METAETELKFEAMIPFFPPDIRQDILFRLPLESLIRCTSVCKAWRSVIRDPIFIRAHLGLTANFDNLNDKHLVLLHCVSGSKCMNFYHRTLVDGVVEDDCSLHYDNQAFDEYCKIEFPIAYKKLRNPYFRVVNICDGLVCLADDMLRYGYNFIIWNPFIRKLVTLPRPGVTSGTHGEYDATIGFGFDAMTNDYKLVRLVHLKSEYVTVAEVYSLAKDSWTSLGSVPPSIQIDGAAFQAFVNGALHWPATRLTNGGSHYFILAFDLGSELFREMLMPKSFKWDSALELRLSVSGDGKSLALFAMNTRCKDSFLEIWVMKEYGIKESWTKLITLGPQGPKRLLPRALCFRKNGEVVLMLCGVRVGFFPDTEGNDSYQERSLHDLVSLDLVSEQFKSLGVSGYQYCFLDSYKESLLLLDTTYAVSY